MSTTNGTSDPFDENFDDDVAIEHFAPVVETLPLPTSEPPAVVVAEELQAPCLDPRDGSKRYTDWPTARQMMAVDVVKIPIYIKPPQYDDVVWAHGFHAVAHNDHVFSVGREYQPVQNSSIIEQLDTIQEKLGLQFIDGMYDGRGVFQWRFRKPDHVVRIQPQGTDRVFETEFQVTVKNSYDMSTSLEFRIGGFIRYCQNIFGLPTKFVKGGIGVLQSHKHSKSAPRLVSTIVENSDLLMASFDTLQKKTWGTLPLPLIHERIEKAFPTNPKTQRKHMVAALIDSKVENEKFMGGDFDYFMAITNMTTFPDKYGLLVSHHEKLEKLAESFWNNN